MQRCPSLPFRRSHERSHRHHPSPAHASAPRSASAGHRPADAAGRRDHVRCEWRIHPHSAALPDDPLHELSWREEAEGRPAHRHPGARLRQCRHRRALGGDDGPHEFRRHAAEEGTASQGGGHRARRRVDQRPAHRGRGRTSDGGRREGLVPPAHPRRVPPHHPRPARRELRRQRSQRSARGSRLARLRTDRLSAHRLTGTHREVPVRRRGGVERGAEHRAATETRGDPLEPLPDARRLSLAGDGEGVPRARPRQQGAC